MVRTIPIPPPWGYEGREVAVGFCEGDGVVTVPGIEYGLLGVCWNGSGLVERGPCVVHLPGCVLVQLLKINGPPEGPVLLGAYDHSMAPSVRGPQGDLLQDSEADIPVEAGLHFALPVYGDGDGSVVGFGGGCGVDVEAQWRAGHHGEGLVLADIESTGCVQVP